LPANGSNVGGIDTTVRPEEGHGDSVNWPMTR